mmetsp:Transcript_39907/g.114355  ORF Transcript_39907/g.114355 Transcript_39907/m.114355 type:complete len:217 (+) Transcript_39907:344-994(+)
MQRVAMALFAVRPIRRRGAGSRTRTLRRPIAASLVARCSQLAAACQVPTKFSTTRRTRSAQQPAPTEVAPRFTSQPHRLPHASCSAFGPQASRPHRGSGRWLARHSLPSATLRSMQSGLPPQGSRGTTKATSGIVQSHLSRTPSNSCGVASSSSMAPCCVRIWCAWGRMCASRPPRCPGSVWSASWQRGRACTTPRFVLYITALMSRITRPSSRKA